MSKIKVLCILVVMLATVIIASSAMAMTVENGVIKVGASDVVLDQSSTSLWGEAFSGYDYRLQYSRVDDKYAQNGDTANPVLDGWANALFSVNNMSTLSTWDNYKFVGRTANQARGTGEAIYKFDLSGTGKALDKLVIINATAAWLDGVQPTYAEFSVSTDGINWHVYARPTSSSTYNPVGTSPSYDITSYVKGSNVYYIRVVVDPFWSNGTVELFRGGGYGHFDNKVWLSDNPIQETAIGDAKQAADDATVYVSGIVTDARSGFFYMEDENRTSGLRVSIPTTSNAPIGYSVLVGGTMTTVNGERVLASTSVSTLDAATVAPLFLNNKAIAGGNEGNTIGADGGAGLNNIGLLVTTTGKITAVETVDGKAVLTIDDGSGVGVKIPGVNGSWTTGAYLSVTGISSIWTGNGGRQRMIIPSLGLTTIGSGIKVGTSDLVEGQSSTNQWGEFRSGYSYRLQYSLVNDAYAKNGNTTAPFASGWASCVYSSTNMARIIQSDGVKYLGRASNTFADFGGQYANIVWKFDFTDTNSPLAAMFVTAASAVWYDNHTTSVKWSFSPDGVNWTEFCNPTSSSAQSPVGVSPSYEITDGTSIFGAQVVYLKAELSPYWMSNSVELFRDFGYDGFDIKCWF